MSTEGTVIQVNEVPQQRQLAVPKGKLLGLDVGLARIGVAVCDPLQLNARPLTVIERGSRRQDFGRLAELVDEEEVQAVVCGLPLNMDGSEGDQARTVRKWTMRLAHALRTLIGHPLPIIFWDERLSTYAANEFAAQESDSFGDDAVAAAIILQRFLDRDAASALQDFGHILLPERESGQDPSQASATVGDEET